MMVLDLTKKEKEKKGSFIILNTRVVQGQKLWGAIPMYVLGCCGVPAWI